MITDKITLRINRKVSTNDTSVEWKAEAEERCSQVAPQFDLGCQKARDFESHVFCLANLCSCYIQYSACSSKGNNEALSPELQVHGADPGHGIEHQPEIPPETSEEPEPGNDPETSEEPEPGNDPETSEEPEPDQDSPETLIEPGPGHDSPETSE